jgi:PadR family transcriptional regulator, regulatory protein PadR
MGDERTSMLQGTLELLILKIVSHEAMHGWGITQRIEHVSQRVLLVNQGSLYPALERLTRRGWVRSEWRTTDSNRRARFYEITAAGRRRLAVEEEGWARVSGAVNAILAWNGALP